MKKILGKLCMLDGVPGYERETRDAIQRMVEPHADDMTVDGMGNLLVFKKGGLKRVRPLVVAAHMDEAGFLVSGYTDDGCLKLTAAGATDLESLTGCRVKVGPQKRCGIITRKSVELAGPAERKAPLTLADLCVDIGCASMDAARVQCAIGDPVSFESSFVEYGDGCIKAKALGSRTGCAAAIMMLKDALAYDTWFAFTTGGVIGETGSRGSIAVGNRLQPGGALILEGSAADDLPGVPAHMQYGQLRQGPMVSLIDIETVYHRGLRKKVLLAAGRAGVLYQYRRGGAGGNDAAALHVSGSGALAFGLAVPTRYSGSPANVICYADLEEMYKLAVLFNEEAGELDV